MFFTFPERVRAFSPHLYFLEKTKGVLGNILFLTRGSVNGYTFAPRETPAFFDFFLKSPVPAINFFRNVR